MATLSDGVTRATSITPPLPVVTTNGPTRATSISGINAAADVSKASEEVSAALTKLKELNTNQRPLNIKNVSPDNTAKLAALADVQTKLLFYLKLKAASLTKVSLNSAKSNADKIALLEEELKAKTEQHAKAIDILSQLGIEISQLT
jgi:hypothetical protein